MTRVGKEIKISYKKIKTTPEEVERKIDEAFELLFNEVLKDFSKKDSLKLQI